jgi:hypothetical protein
MNHILNSTFVITKRIAMPILQIEHKVIDFEGWKSTFEKDPLDRKKSGVRRYKIYRPTDDPNYVIVDLEFDNVDDIEAMLAALRNLWNKVEGMIMTGAKTRILDMVESKEY